jgi:hypothetical protein
LTRRFSCPIDIEDEPAIFLPIPQSSGALVGGKAAGQQILNAERPQGFHRFSGQGG